MLTFSRRTEQERKPLQLSSIVKESVRLLRASIPTTISIRTNVRSESGVILGDPVQIQQVLMNLATNAAYAMREKGGSPGHRTQRFQRLLFQRRPPRHRAGTLHEAPRS